MGTGSLPGVKRPGRGIDHPPHLVPRLKKAQSYTSTTPLGLRGMFQGDLYLYCTSLCQRRTCYPQVTIQEMAPRKSNFA